MQNIPQSARTHAPCDSHAPSPPPSGLFYAPTHPHTMLKAHPKTARITTHRQAASRAGDPRGTAAWQRLRAQQKALVPYCERCGSTDDLTADHIIPVGRGGPPHTTHLATLCRQCNSAKRDRADG